MSSVAAIPAGFHSLTPYLVVEDAAAAVELYQKAFGAEVTSLHKTPDGKVMNAQLKIGDSMFMLNDEFPDYGVLGPKKIGGTAVTLHIYTPDVDALWAKATGAGLEVSMPLGVQPWGDKYGSLKDPFGHSWSMASHLEEVSDEELEKRMSEIQM